jgi:uncharacterized protein YjiS (DUF1127 family)
VTTFRLDITQIFDGFDISGKVYNFITGVEAIYVATRDTISVWIMRSEGRKQLAQMSDHMLKDIGLNRIDVQYDAGKFFWQE